MAAVIVTDKNNSGVKLIFRGDYFPHDTVVLL